MLRILNRGIELVCMYCSMISRQGPGAKYTGVVFAWTGVTQDSYNQDVEPDLRNIHWVTEAEVLPICSSARKCGDSWEMESSSNLFIYMWRGKSERASAKFAVSCQKMVWKEIILQWVLKLRNSTLLSSFFPIAMSQHKGWEKKSAWWPSLVFLNQHCYMVDYNTLYRQI